MSHVSTEDLSKHLHHKPKPIDVGPGQTYDYAGTGAGMTFIVHGSGNSQHFANAHLDLGLGSPGFEGTIKLGKDADVMVEKIHATSYNYDAETHHLNLFAGNLAIDGLTIDTGGRQIAVANFPEQGTLISTGRFSPGEGSHYAIPVHAISGIV